MLLKFAFFISHDSRFVSLLALFVLTQSNTLLERFDCICYLKWLLWLFYLFRLRLYSPLNRLIEVALTEDGTSRVHLFGARRCRYSLTLPLSKNSFRRWLESFILNFLPSGNGYPLGDYFPTYSRRGLVLDKGQLLRLVCELNLGRRRTLLVVGSCKASVEKGLLAIHRLVACDFVFVSSGARNSVYPRTHAALWWALFEATTDGDWRRNWTLAWTHGTLPLSIHHGNFKLCKAFLLIDNSITFPMQSRSHCSKIQNQIIFAN